MRYVKWGFLILVVVLVGGFLHYTLPRHDVVRIVETEVRRVEVGSSMFWNSAEPNDANAGNRDVKFISTIRENGKPLVYRNEDTGWGWPPYYKFNSADLQARAADLVSTKSAPQWVLVTRYGWRNQLFSIYPNTLKVKPVDSPDARVIPWLNIVIIGGLIVLLLLIRRLWKRFWANRVDPVVAEVSSAFDKVDASAEVAQKRFRTRSERFREWWVETFG